MTWTWQYDKIGHMTEIMYQSMPESLKPSFFELVYYPVRGAELKNKEMLYAQLNRKYADEKRALTNYWADKIAAYHDSIADMTKIYNAQLSEKWNSFMAG